MEKALGEGVEAISVSLDPRAIESEITRIRDRESNPYIAGTRTNLFTLVVKEGRAASEIVDGALGFLLGKRPGRIIRLRDGEEERSSVYVSGRCFPDVHNRGVCFEEIQVQNGRDDCGSDVGTWSPLLIRDLPVYVWWLDAVSADVPLLREAAELVDKVVFDAGFSLSIGERPLDALAAVRELRRATRAAFTVSDLAWRRMQAFRVQTARSFNPEAQRKRLTTVSRVSLYGGSPAEAALYFLWLSARLGWKARETDTGSWSATDGSGMSVQLRHASSAPLSAGLAVSFACADGGPDLPLSCDANGCVSADGESRGVHAFLSDGEALLEELDAPRQDAVLLEVLDLAALAGGATL